MKTTTQIIAIYVARYPHLAALAANNELRALGSAMASLAYPDGITGADALVISKLGLGRAK